jgi:hypothetical protein
MKHRKCDSAKYRKRKARALENRKENKVEQRYRDDHWAKIKEKNHQDRLRMEEFEREWRLQEQRLVNVLAKRLCQLSPEYEKELSSKEAMRNIRGIFGVLRQFGGAELFATRVVSEEPFMAIEEKNA